MKLQLEPPKHFRPDEVYEKLLAIGQGQTDRQARRAMAALTLLLVNHIGDEEVLDEALAIVRQLPNLGQLHGEEHHG